MKRACGAEAGEGPTGAGGSLLRTAFASKGRLTDALGGTVDRPSRSLVRWQPFRASDTVIRIISARKATTPEQQQYEQGWVP